LGFRIFRAVIAARFRVWGLEVRVWDPGFRVWGLGMRAGGS
jgi:hypothetical protein